MPGINYGGDSPEAHRKAAEAAPPFPHGALSYGESARGKGLTDRELDLIARAPRAGGHSGHDADDEDLHPGYGGCDAFGPKGGCSQCTGLIARNDGVTVTLGGAVHSIPAPARRIADAFGHLKAAWHALTGSGYREDK
jgi:hypothetical protein